MQRTCKLFEQFLCHIWCKIESEKLPYITSHQEDLRASEFTTLMEKLGDAIQDFNEFKAVRGEAPMRGRVVVLPSTYVGSVR